MFSTEQRRIAIEIFIRFDRNYADTIAELGYPHRQTLRKRISHLQESAHKAS